LKTITILSYLIFFLGIGGIYLVERKKLGISPKIAPSVIRWVLLIGLFIRLILAVTVENFSTDIV
jgi:hypothetical protein